MKQKKNKQSKQNDPKKNGKNNHVTDIELDILSLLRDHDAQTKISGITCTHIAQELHTSPQSVNYTLKKLQQKCLVFMEPHEKTYYLQPFLASDEVSDAIVQAFSEVMEKYQSLITVSEFRNLTEDAQTDVFYDAMVVTALLTLNELVEANDE